MRTRYHISEEQLAELMQVRKKNKDKNIEKRMEALVLHAQGKKMAEIAEKTGYSKDYISKLAAKYCKEGITAIAEKHYPGNHRNLSYAEEEALLEPFKKKADAGQMVEISAIKAAYEEKIGRSLERDHGQIYRVLKRHGWRKVMPRSKHPGKASEEAIEASKKLKLRSEENWKIMQADKSD
jgi:transposase